MDYSVGVFLFIRRDFMPMFCARLKEVMVMKRAFIKQYGEQTLIDDANKAQSMKEMYDKKYQEYKNAN